MTIRLSARKRKRERRDSEDSSGKLAKQKCSFREVNQGPDKMPNTAECKSQRLHQWVLTKGQILVFSYKQFKRRALSTMISFRRIICANRMILIIV